MRTTAHIDERLREAAITAWSRAHAPHSRFAVGAAVEMDDGTIHLGCNVENAAYGDTICAERVALLSSIAAGYPAGVARRLLVYTSAKAPTPPCGSCRQVIAELAPQAIVTSLTANGQAQSWHVEELLPQAFTTRQLHDGQDGRPA